MFRITLKVIFLLACALNFFACLAAQPVIFENYGDFYKALPNPLFSESDKKQLVQAGQDFSTTWETRLEQARSTNAKRSHTASIVGDAIVVDGRRLNAKKALLFPGTFTTGLGRRATLYANDEFLCVDGVAPTASGTASRHLHVTLITNPYRKDAMRIELPSLFASCLGISRAGNGSVNFFAAAYRSDRANRPTSGVNFTQYSLANRAFHATGVTVKTGFIEPENVYRFSIVP